MAGWSVAWSRRIKYGDRKKEVTFGKICGLSKDKESRRPAEEFVIKWRCVVWCGVVWFGVVVCSGVAWCGVMWRCGVVWRGVV